MRNLPVLGAAGVGGNIDERREATWWCSEHPLRQRDRLAEIALQGLLSAEAPIRSKTFAETMVVNAYTIADKMLKLRREQIEARQQLEERSKGSK